MISLTSRQRSLVLFFSASGYIAWFSGVGERTEAQDIAGMRTPILTLATPSMPPRVTSVIRRDPFAGAPDRPESDASGTNAARTASPSVDISDQAPLPAGIVPNPGGVPDIVGESDAPASGSGDGAFTLVVRATITGPNPVAYVANGTAMDIVRIGDRLGERRVAKIDLRGLAFADGSRLDLPGNFEATPAPRVAPGGITIRLDDLRKLLIGDRRETNLPTPLPGPSVTTVAVPAPAATGSYPTPGPLPTVDRRGIPVGTNPTSDPNGATPLPEPYPYAPPRHP